MQESRKKVIKVLIIDDSSLVRETFAKGLALDPGIEVVATAADAYIARDKILKYRPDVLTLDVEMPKMDGVDFLRYLMPQYPIPVIMVSSLTQTGKKITIEALEAGAVDFVPKPSSNLAHGLNEMLMELRTKIKIASTANVSHWKNKKKLMPSQVIRKVTALSESTDKVIAIGASTGGTEAIRKVITQFSVNMPGVVIVQHMPPGFTKMYAERMNHLCSMEVKEAETDDRVMPGKILIAPGDKHMEIIRSGGIYKIICREGEKVSGHCPSVDVMMTSVAKNVGNNAVGIILTGMGSDGAKGMLAMKEAGARTIAQDEASCVVFGMPKKAFENGGAEKLVALDNIGNEAVNLLK